MNHPLTFILFGRSGSGKGTQARLLAKFLNENTSRKALYIETGQKFRDFIEKSDSYSSTLTRDVIENGGLMPEFLPIWIWTDFFVNNFTGEEHLVLDGLSRRIDEAPILENALRFYRRERIFVIHLNVPREKAFAMMKSRGREDDTDDYINNRLDWFENTVMPVVEHFRSREGFQFLDVSGEQSIEKVHEDILRAAGLTA